MVNTLILLVPIAHARHTSTKSLQSFSFPLHLLSLLADRVWICVKYTKALVMIPIFAADRALIISVWWHIKSWVEVGWTYLQVVAYSLSDQVIIIYFQVEFL